MKNLCFALLLMASAAFVLLGCSDKSGPIVAPSEQTVASSATSHPNLAKGGVVVGSAQGGGHFITPNVPITGFSSVKFAFTALKYEDNTYGGQVEMDLVGFPPSLIKKIHGTVKGVKFYGKVAMCWAEVRTEFLVDMFGEATWRQIFVVTDNGEGKNSVPDRMSIPWFTTDAVWPGEFDTYWALSAEDFLATIPANLGIPADYPLATGNIQVREK